MRKHFTNGYTSVEEISYLECNVVSIYFVPITVCTNFFHSAIVSFTTEIIMGK